MTKRYLLFAGENYYPGGGWHDFKGAFDTPDEAVKVGTALYGPDPRDDWWHVIDQLTGKCIAAHNEWNLKEINAER